MHYRTSDGWSVEVIQLSGTPDHHDGTWLRVCYFGSFVADVRTPEELARYFPLSELEPLEPSLTGLMSEPVSGPRHSGEMSVSVMRGSDYGGPCALLCGRCSAAGGGEDHDCPFGCGSYSWHLVIA
jgi:hypothetical protein